MSGKRPLADVYRSFGEAASRTSQLHGRLALAIAGSAEALRAIETAPASQRRPALVLAALNYLAIAGRAPALAAAYAADETHAAADVAIDTLLQRTGEVLDVAGRHRFWNDEGGRYSVLYPLIAEAAHRTGATALGLIDVGRPAGLNLNVDRVDIDYAGGPRLGDTTSTVGASAQVVGAGRVPERQLPPVVARVCLDDDPLDATDAEVTRWLRACLPPDRADMSSRLEAELVLAAHSPRHLVSGDPAGSLADAVALVPEEALAVVVTTWSLSRFRPEVRGLFLDRLDEVARGRAVAWVAAEGVGVAPTVPTLGDRPASGHSILGLLTWDGSARTSSALGRCWSKGEMLEWLADE